MEKVRLKKDKERAAKNRHPWVFSGAIAQMPTAEDGEIVELCTYDDQWLGYGFFTPKSQISVRVFEFSLREVNPFSPEYWEKKLQTAYQLRKTFLSIENTTTFRLINAEGDFFPGLIVDVYRDVAVMQILIKGVERLLPIIAEQIVKLGYPNIYLKTKDVSERIENITTRPSWVSGGRDEDKILVYENGHKFWVDFKKGQKTGFFIDQRENRALVGLYSYGRRVLNAFSFSGGFSVYALANGAELVHSVDSSKSAIELCQINVEENFGTEKRHKTFCVDCFDYLRQNNERYNLIILDPPAFAKTAKSVSNATRGYKDLNYIAIKAIESNGLLFTFSCSQKIDRDLFRKIVFSAAADSGRNVRILHQLSQPIDHPINIYHPESEYLKGFVLQVE